MTFGTFVLGVLIAGVGFLMVWKRNAFREYVGDLSVILDYPNISWLDWSYVGFALIVLGFMVALGLAEFFLAATLGRVLRPTIG